MLLLQLVVDTPTYHTDSGRLNEQVIQYRLLKIGMFLLRRYLSTAHHEQILQLKVRPEPVPKATAPLGEAAPPNQPWYLQSLHFQAH